METMIIVLDFILIAAAIYAIISAKGLGGAVGDAFNFIVWGMIFLGVAHISETITFEMLKWEIDVVELIHRFIVLAGFVFLSLAFARIKRAFSNK